MARTAEDLFREALALSEEEREKLVRLLTMRPDASFASPDVDPAWLDECERRLRAIDRGEMDLTPAEEAHRQARQEISK